MSEPVRIVALGDVDTRLWSLTKEVASILGDLPWVLIGGQMVAAIEAEHGAAVGRTTVDVDTLVDVRAATNATLLAAHGLMEAGFVPERQGDDLTYRFIRGGDVVDVLAPDHVGERADIRTLPPGTTIEVAGGRQALDRRRTFQVAIGDDIFDLPVPTLLGAIVMKARATASSRSGEEKHRRDLARLLALVGDPAQLRAQMSLKERGYLRSRAELRDPEHPAWRGIPRAEDAIGVLERLAT